MKTKLRASLRNQTPVAAEVLSVAGEVATEAWNRKDPALEARQGQIVWAPPGTMKGCFAELMKDLLKSKRKEDSAKVRELLKTMKELKSLLLNENLKDDYLAAAFQLLPGVGASASDSIDSLAEELNKMRTTGIKLMSDLINSVQVPNPQNRDELDKLCIKHNSIIVTTVDCTLKLHDMEAYPFDVICKEAGYSVSIFDKMRQSVPKKVVMLKQQFAIDPLITTKNSNRMLSIAVVCISSDEADTIQDWLRSKSGLGMEDPTRPNICYLVYETKEASQTFALFLQSREQGNRCSNFNLLIWYLHKSSDGLLLWYGKMVTKKFQSEDIADRGIQRLENAFAAFESLGVMARNESGSEYREFKISGHELVDHSNSEAVTELLDTGNIMVGRFRLSRNYYSLKPGEVYVYDADQQIYHPKSGLAASHGAMMIGSGRTQTKLKENGKPVYARHMVMQNSEGDLFGINGIGRVGKKTVTELYRIHVPEANLCI
ncbi:hypothetical protein EJB05_26212, partial [Eragrostis curvula]